MQLQIGVPRNAAENAGEKIKRWTVCDGLVMGAFDMSKRHSQASQAKVQKTEWKQLNWT